MDENNERWKTILNGKIVVGKIVLFKNNIVSPVGLGPDFSRFKPATASPLGQVTWTFQQTSDVHFPCPN